MRHIKIKSAEYTIQRIREQITSLEEQIKDSALTEGERENIQRIIRKKKQLIDDLDAEIENDKKEMIGLGFGQS